MRSFRGSIATAERAGDGARDTGRVRERRPLGATKALAKLMQLGEYGAVER